VRAVGARFLTGNAVERRLPAAVRSDPDARVRAAAAVALAKTHTAWGVDGCIPALADPDPLVRSAAAEALGALGAPVVPTLEDVVRTRPAEARGALTALALAGSTGEQALRRLIVDLPDPKLREFARLALGQGPRAH
jgi:HEAT repeat protein